MGGPMRYFSPRLTTLVVTASLAVTGSPWRSDSATRPVSRTVRFARQALASRLVATAFHPEGYDHAGSIHVIIEGARALKLSLVAEVREPWSTQVQAFPRTSGRQRPRHSPWEVENLLRNTGSETEAIHVLEWKLHWSPSPWALAQYMNKYGISTPWKPFGTQGDVLW